MDEQQRNDESRPFHREGPNFIFDKPKSLEEIAHEAGDREQLDLARGQLEVARGQLELATKEAGTNLAVAVFTGLLFLLSCFGSLLGFWQAYLAQTSANAATLAAVAAQDSLKESRYSRQSGSRAAQRAREENDTRNLATLAQSKSALDASIRTLEVSERPWVDAEVHLTSPIIINLKELSVGVSTTPRNIGHSIATNVITRARVVQIAIGAGRFVRDDQNRLCSSLYALSGKFGSEEEAIFPSKEGLAFSFELSTAPTNPPPGLGVSSFFYIVGCIDYTASFGAPKHYQTRFLYDLNVLKSGMVFGIDVNTDRTIPMNQINFRRNFSVIGGNSAK